VKVDNRVLLTERDRRRFFREVTAAGRLSGHPHVIDVYDAGTLDDGRPYLVMELCPVGSLNDMMHRHGPMEATQVRDIGIKIADALAAAHQAGVLHRDIKPANILVNRYGVVGLSDFGLASIIAAGGDQTASRDALTPAFSAPEGFRGEAPTALADIYALAATLYALLAGRPPSFGADGRVPSLMTIMALHDKPVDDVPGTPPEFMALLRRGGLRQGHTHLPLRRRRHRCPAEHVRIPPLTGRGYQGRAHRAHRARGTRAGRTRRGAPGPGAGTRAGHTWRSGCSGNANTRWISGGNGAPACRHQT
jgi:serine/threonine protein kinase